MNLKQLILRMLVYSPIPYSARINTFLKFPLLRKWKNMQQKHPYYLNREQVYEYVNTSILKNEAICYLEFGVHQGASIKKWMEINTNENSSFVGFDSFIGLPEKWGLVNFYDKGHFSTNGKTPDSQDSRVSFVSGWFHESLPPFLKNFPINGRRLVIHCDADLYSSTLYVLCRMNEYLVPGTVILFDEFSCMDDEFKALEDYTKSYHKSYKLLAAGGQVFYEKVAIEIL